MSVATSSPPSIEATTISVNMSSETTNTTTEGNISTTISTQSTEDSTSSVPDQGNTTTVSPTNPDEHNSTTSTESTRNSTNPDEGKSTTSTESSLNSTSSRPDQDSTTAVSPIYPDDSSTISIESSTLYSTRSHPDRDNITTTIVDPTITSEDNATTFPGGTERTATNKTHPDDAGISIQIIYYGVIPGSVSLVFIFILLLVFIKRRKRRNASKPFEDPPDGKLTEVDKKTDIMPRYSTLILTSTNQVGNGCIVMDNSEEDAQENQDDYDQVDADINDDEKSSNRNSEQGNYDTVSEHLNESSNSNLDSDDPDDYATVDGDVGEHNHTNTDRAEGHDDYDVVDKDILEKSLASISNDEKHKNETKDGDDDTQSYQTDTVMKNTSSSTNSSSADTENTKTHPCSNRNTKNLDSPRCQIKKTDSKVSLTNTDELHSAELLSSNPTDERPRETNDLCKTDNEDDDLYDHTEQSRTQSRNAEVGYKCISPRSECDTADDVYNHLTHNKKPNLFTNGDEQRLSDEYSHITFNAKPRNRSRGASVESYSHVTYDPRKGSFRVLDHDNDDTYDLSGHTTKTKTAARADDYSHVVNIRATAPKQNSGNYDTMEFTIPDNTHSNDYSCVVKTA